jgi:serine/threonine protein kinase
MTTLPLNRLGRYELLELLGRGGMAEVYKARLTGAAGITKLVAVKRIVPEAVRDPNFVDLFIREARLSSRMMHPNLITVFEFSQNGDELFLVMDLVEGCDLRQVLLANRTLGKGLPLEFAVCIANGILRGLESAHRLTDEEGRNLGVVHRDLSPANVLLSYEGAIKVADFGVAQSKEARADPTEADQVKGKLQYMAPEQLASTDIDPRVDVFSAGAVLYEMITGTPLYAWTHAADVVMKVARARFTPVEQLMPDLDRGLVWLLNKALAADRAQRYPTCEQFAVELNKLVQQGRVPCAEQSELGLYLQVLVPKRPFRAELFHTPGANSLGAAPLPESASTSIQVQTNMVISVEDVASSVATTEPAIQMKPRRGGSGETDPGFSEIAQSTPPRDNPAPVPPQTDPAISRRLAPMEHRSVRPGTGPHDSATSSRPGTGPNEARDPNRSFEPDAIHARSPTGPKDIVRPATPPLGGDLVRPSKPPPAPTLTSATKAKEDLSDLDAMLRDYISETGTKSEPTTFESEDEIKVEVKVEPEPELELDIDLETKKKKPWFKRRK